MQSRGRDKRGAMTTVIKEFCGHTPSRWGIHDSTFVKCAP